ncbi:MAG TPA: hypothetical protein VKV17_03640 [Bryobacteraceae bacterium]|nr:hypothetical protein [Bryobacteraceae bacterium]
MNRALHLLVLLLLVIGGQTSAAGISGARQGIAADPLLTRARQAVFELTEALPDFVCRETVSRYRASSLFSEWLPLDRLAADVIFENGKERYQKLSINGKPVHRRIDQLSGAWSTGEFGSVLLQLFSPVTAAEFRPAPDEVPRTLSEIGTYGFEVSPSASQWMISVDSRVIVPPYKGSIQINLQTAGVSRLEMRAEDLPSTFPAYLVESAIDYQPVTIGGKVFLLPARSEMVMCFRDKSLCVRNTIAFTDYHKFASESRLYFLAP